MATSYWKSMAAGLKGPTSGRKMKALRADFVPVYVALGMITLSLSFGLHTAKQQLMYSPNVFVRKSRRETIPEVAEPSTIVEDARKFINRSFFRKVAHVQEFHPRDSSVPNGPIHGAVYAQRPRSVTLESVGVDVTPRR